MGRPDQPRGRDGRWVARGTGAVAVGAVIAFGASGIGGAGAGGAATESLGAANGQAARVARGRQAAEKGRADDAWRGLRLRKVRQVAEHALDCAANSYGQVRDFFTRTPCRSLDRALFTLADPSGATFVVSVSWVRTWRGDDVGRLKRLIDVDGTGSVTPLASGALRAQGVRFTGVPFRSRPRGDLLVVAEGAVVSGEPDPAFFADVVDVAARLPG